MLFFCYAYFLSHLKNCFSNKRQTITLKVHNKYVWLNVLEYCLPHTHNKNRCFIIKETWRNTVKLMLIKLPVSTKIDIIAASYLKSNLSLPHFSLYTHTHMHTHAHTHAHTCPQVCTHTGTHVSTHSHTPI